MSSIRGKGVGDMGGGAKAREGAELVQSTREEGGSRTEEEREVDADLDSALEKQSEHLEKQRETNPYLRHDVENTFRPRVSAPSKSQAKEMGLSRNERDALKQAEEAGTARQSVGVMAGKKVSWHLEDTLPSGHKVVMVDYDKRHFKVTIKPAEGRSLNDQIREAMGAQRGLEMARKEAGVDDYKVGFLKVKLDPEKEKYDVEAEDRDGDTVDLSFKPKNDFLKEDLGYKSGERDAIVDAEDIVVHQAWRATVDLDLERSGIDDVDGDGKAVDDNDFDLLIEQLDGDELQEYAENLVWNPDLVNNKKWYPKGNKSGDFKSLKRLVPRDFKAHIKRGGDWENWGGKEGQYPMLDLAIELDYRIDQVRELVDHGGDLWDSLGSVQRHQLKELLEHWDKDVSPGVDNWAEAAADGSVDRVKAEGLFEELQKVGIIIDAVFREPDEYPDFGDYHWGPGLDEGFNAGSLSLDTLDDASTNEELIDAMDLHGNLRKVDFHKRWGKAGGELDVIQYDIRQDYGWDTDICVQSKHKHWWPEGNSKNLIKELTKKRPSDRFARHLENAPKGYTPWEDAPNPNKHPLIGLGQAVHQNIEFLKLLRRDYRDGWNKLDPERRAAIRKIIDHWDDEVVPSMDKWAQHAIDEDYDIDDATELFVEMQKVALAMEASLDWGKSEKIYEWGAGVDEGAGHFSLDGVYRMDGLEDIDDEDHFNFNTDLPTNFEIEDDDEEYSDSESSED